MSFSGSLPGSLWPSLAPILVGGMVQLLTAYLGVASCRGALAVAATLVREKSSTVGQLKIGAWYVKGNRHYAMLCD